ncbi:hypothetical protein [Actinacidiphila rubida]|uniref:hypothetical protein n=1 Tax=Actinacidiphila rubida TaxID=310780 RepID=UPI00114CF4EF|nr:hypothetical protein [Actinacidiphila rubida]
MSGETISVIVAVVGVGGTLTSAVVTQIFAQRTESRRLEHEERVRAAKRRAAKDQRRIDQLRDCYVQLNAHDRHYRDAMLAYAYALKSGSFDAEAAEVSNARRTQRDTRAEAQLVASDAVLELEYTVNDRLTIAYRELMKIAGGEESPARLERLDRVIVLLDSIVSQQENVRARMRLEVRAAQGPPDETRAMTTSS